MHLNSQLAFQRYAVPFLADGQRVIEIGPDSDPSTYRQQVTDLDLDWETADLADDLMPESSTFRPVRRLTHVMRNEYEISIPGDSVDVVIAGNVIEHVRKIWVWIAELARITRPGGRVIIISPISWPFHEAPFDCWRIYPDGMRALCTEAGLAVELSEQVALEPRRSRRSYFAESYEYIRQLGQSNALSDALKATIGWPIPTALDLVTVATKQPRSTNEVTLASGNG